MQRDGLSVLIFACTTFLQLTFCLVSVGGESHLVFPTDARDINDCMTSLACAKADVIRKFEKDMKVVRHGHCHICRRISLNLSVRKSRASGLLRCEECVGSKRESPPAWLPTWTDPNGTFQYRLPSELLDLREAEKLLLQIYAVYIPMHHLRKGAHGSSGHVCSFPQNIASVCHDLPRTTVDVIRVIKKYKTADGGDDAHVFRIRKKKVLDALYWLKT